MWFFLSCFCLNINDIENCVRNLKSLGVPTLTYGSLLIPVLNERIPEELSVMISRKFGNDVWSLDQMLAYFNEELLVKERCTGFNRLSYESRDFPSNSRHKDHFTAANLFSQEADDDDWWRREDQHL